MLTPRNQFPEGRPFEAHLSLRWLPSEAEKSLQQLKGFLLRRLTEEYSGLLSESLIIRSVNEADSLAILTPFPHLFLPELASEKVRETVCWLSRQQDIWDRSVVVVTA